MHVGRHRSNPVSRTHQSQSEHRGRLSIGKPGAGWLGEPDVIVCVIGRAGHGDITMVVVVAWSRGTAVDGLWRGEPTLERQGLAGRTATRYPDAPRRSKARLVAARLSTHAVLARRSPWGRRRSVRRRRGAGFAATWSPRRSVRAILCNLATPQRHGRNHDRTRGAVPARAGSPLLQPVDDARHWARYAWTAEASGRWSPGPPRRAPLLQSRAAVRLPLPSPGAGWEPSRRGGEDADPPRGA